MKSDSLITRDRGGPTFFERLFGVEADPEPVYERRRYRGRRFGGGPFN
jgi:hypothetical protein